MNAAMEYTEMLEFLKKTPTGDLTDAMRRLGISGYTKGIYRLQGGRVPNMVGPALTVQYIPKQPGQPGGLPGQFAIARMCTGGQVMVVAAQGTRCWLTGGNVARVAQLAGAAGIVVDGCIRDKAEIISHSMPFYCKGSGTRPYAEELQLAGVNVPIDLDGCRVNPGDIVVGDGDGIVILPSQRLEEIIYQAEEISEIEIALAQAVERQASLEELDAIGGRKPVVRA